MRESKPKPRVIKDFAGLRNLLEAEALEVESPPQKKPESKKTPNQKRAPMLETIFDLLSEESRRFLSEQIAKLKSEDKNSVLVLQQDPLRYIRLALEKSRSPVEKALLEKITKDLRRSISNNSRKATAPKPEAEKVAKKTPEVKAKEVTPNNDGAEKGSTIREPEGEKTFEENPLLPVDEKHPSLEIEERNVGTIDTEGAAQKETENPSPEESATNTTQLESILGLLPSRIVKIIENEIEDLKHSEEDPSLSEWARARILLLENDPIKYFNNKQKEAEEDLKHYTDPVAISEDGELYRAKALEASDVLAEITPVLEKEEGDLAKELKNLRPAERKALGLGIHNIGFQIERWKNNTFAWAFDSLDSLSHTKVKKEDGKEKRIPKKGFVADLIRASRNSFKADAEMAEKKILVGKNPPGLTKLSNVAYLAKNFLRPYGIFMMTSTGITPANVRKGIMLGGMAAGRMAGITKEAILSSDKVLDQTQFSSSSEDIDAAQDEANKIYELARTKAGKGGTTEKVSAEALKKAYLSAIPKDLEERLKNKPETASIFKKDIFRMHLEFDINRLNKNIEDIEKNSKYTQVKKEELKEQLLRRWEKRLTDYDRVLTRIGTIEQYSMWASYAEAGAKNVVRGMTVLAAANLAEHAYMNLGKVWDWFSDENSDATPEPSATPTATPAIDKARGSFSRRIGEHQVKFGQGKFGEAVFKDKIETINGLGMETNAHSETIAHVSNQATAPTPANATGHPETTATQTPMGTNNEAATGATEAHAEQAKNAVKQAAGKIAETSATPAPEVSNVEITGPTDPAVVQQGKGIEHAFIKQIEGDPRMAEALGYKKGAEDLHKFAGRMAHRIARDNGYVDRNTGEEIYVRKAGEAAYKLIPTGEMGHASVQEFHKEGTEFVAQKLHHTGDAFEEKPDAYEIRHTGTALHTDKTPEVQTTPTETPAQSAVYDQNRPATPGEIQQSLESLGFTGDPTNENEVLEYLKSIGYNNPGDAIRGEELHKAITDTLDSASQTSAPKTEAVAEMLPIFKENIYNLQTPILRIINETHLRNLKALFPENTKNFWESLEKIKFDEFNERFNPNGQVAQYVKTLQEITGEKPKMGIFGLFNKETVGHYIARALQYAGTKPGMLDKLKLK